MVRFLMTLFLLSAGTLSAQVRFVPNEGQWPDHIHHRAEVVGGGVQLERAGWLCWQWAPETEAVLDHHKGARRGIVWQAEWIDADPLAALNWVRSGFASDREHHYLSNDPDQWAEHIQPVSMLKTENVWPGIRLRWRGTRQGRAAFEFTVAPGADPNDIGWRYRGAPGHHTRRRSAIGARPARSRCGVHGRARIAICIPMARRRPHRRGAVPVHPRRAGSPVRGRRLRRDAALGDRTGNHLQHLRRQHRHSFDTTASNGPGGWSAEPHFAPGYPTTPDAVEATMDALPMASATPW